MQATEEVFAALAGAERARVVVTIRGEQRPAGVGWGEPLRVGRLTAEDSREVFVAVAGPAFAADPHLGDIVDALDGWPLALDLMARQAEGQPDLHGLWSRWQSERAAMLARGDGQHRLLSVDVSLRLSIDGSRMTAEARRLLALMGLLPDGVAHDDLSALLPDCGERAAAVLRQTGLAFDEGTRLRLLAPVREHVRDGVPPAEPDLAGAVDHYAALATRGQRVGYEGGAEAVARLGSDWANVEAMLAKGLSRSDPSAILRAACEYARFVRASGQGTTQSIAAAAARASDTGDTANQARCLECLGDIALDRSDHDGARARYDAALPLYRQVGQVLGEANCIWRLGDIALERSDHDGARARYDAALPLYRQVGHLLGEANCIQCLGDIALARSDHDGARARYDAALALYERIAEPYSIGFTHWSLTRVTRDAAERSRHREAARAAWRSIGRDDLIAKYLDPPA